VIEAFFPDDIQDSICVGQRRPTDADESVLLFLLMKPGRNFSQELVKAVKSRIGKECSPRHVPKYVFETPEIPVSLNTVDGEMKRRSTDVITDDGQSQKGRIASQKDCLWRQSHAFRYSTQPAKSGILLQIRQGGRARGQCQE